MKYNINKHDTTKNIKFHNLTLCQMSYNNRKEKKRREKKDIKERFTN